MNLHWGVGGLQLCYGLRKLIPKPRKQRDCSSRHSAWRGICSVLQQGGAVLGKTPPPTCCNHTAVIRPWAVMKGG